MWSSLFSIIVLRSTDRVGFMRYAMMHLNINLALPYPVNAVRYQS